MVSLSVLSTPRVSRLSSGVYETGPETGRGHAEAGLLVCAVSLRVVVSPAARPVHALPHRGAVAQTGTVRPERRDLTPQQRQPAAVPVVLSAGEFKLTPVNMNMTGRGRCVSGFSQRIYATGDTARCRGFGSRVRHLRGLSVWSLHVSPTVQGLAVR